MFVKTKSLNERFWEKVSVKGTDDCWTWTARVNYCGYGTIKIDNKSVLAHRVSWNLAHPDDLVKAGECICHSCDNPPCCNPKHLWKGTIADNNHDAARKKRSRGAQLFGSSNHSSKLKENDILVIRNLREQGYTHWAIADTFGVARSTISNILLGNSWRNA